MDHKALKRHRLRLGLTLDELARYLGLRHRSQACHLESGRSKVYGSKAILLAGLAACRTKGEVVVPPPGHADEPPAPAEVRAFRKRMDWTQEQLSDELGLGGRENASNVERGHMRLVGATLRLYKVLEALHAPPKPQ